MAGKDYLHEVQEAEKKPLWQRVGWLLVIWTASVASLGVFAWLIRLFMTAAGMKSHCWSPLIKKPSTEGFFVCG